MEPQAPDHRLAWPRLLQAFENSSLSSVSPLYSVSQLLNTFMFFKNARIYTQ